MSEHTPIWNCDLHNWHSNVHECLSCHDECKKLIADNKRLKTALQELLVAVCYKTPTVNFGTDKEPNPCYEARVPVQFVHDAHQALNESE